MTLRIRSEIVIIVVLLKLDVEQIKFFDSFTRLKRRVKGVSCPFLRKLSLENFSYSTSTWRKAEVVEVGGHLQCSPICKIHFEDLSKVL